ncbi:hypothetical protein P5673_005529 [Acropora cervicornis]|uniref:Uncharacterized protein n=1 Tax=Acropora cervicornis TaxID=6130 RepID=A0AAD9QYC9_ACRCE|nr:hypothetical protein P5673_005529 [Acropora cervicornis]
MSEFPTTAHGNRIEVKTLVTLLTRYRSETLSNLGSGRIKQLPLERSWEKPDNDESVTGSMNEKSLNLADGDSPFLEEKLRQEKCVITTNRTTAGDTYLLR